MGKARLRAGILGGAIGLAAGTMAIADPDTKGVQIEVAYTRDSNIARVRKEDNRLSDNVLSVDASKQFIRQPSDHTEVLAAIVAGGERFQDFDGLSNAFIGLQLDGLYRSSGALSVPTYRAFLHATQVNYRSDIRDGYRITTGLSVQRYYEDQLKLIAELAYNARHGRDEVFNTRDVSVRGIAEYQVSLRTAFYVIGEYRDGDVVSSAAPSLAYVDLADAIALDDAFPGKGWYAYRFGARTYAATLGLNVTLGTSQALDLSVRTTKSVAKDNLGSAFQWEHPTYLDNQVSLAYLIRF